MKSAGSSLHHILKTLSSSSVELLNVVIFYDRYVCGRFAAHIYDECIRPYIDESRSEFDFWRTDLFDKFAYLYLIAEKKVNKADLVIFSLSEETGLPDGFIDRLENWFKDRTQQEMALVLLLNRTPGKNPQSKLYKTLNEIAKRQKVRFFYKSNVVELGLNK